MIDVVGSVIGISFLAIVILPFALIIWALMQD
jgi:hypothetical protein